MQARECLLCCSSRERELLSAKDPLLGAAIERVGDITRAADPDVFSSIVRHVIGQQISSKAQASIFNKTRALLREVSPEQVVQTDEQALRACGISLQKARTLRRAAQACLNGAIDLGAAETMSDAAFTAMLCAVKGIGPWTAEMVLLFGLRRPDVFSYGDSAIIKGLKRLYERDKIDRPLFEMFRARFSPYGSLASLYLWEIAAGKDNL